MPEKIKGNVVVVGLGYVGLPLCEIVVATGRRVVGIDSDVARVKSVSAGVSPINDLNSSSLGRMLDRGFSAHSDFSVVEGAEVVILCLPTPLDEAGDPDLSALLGGIDSIAPYLCEHTLLVVESTVAPGTTDLTILARLTALGKHLGDDFFLAYSPERVDPGTSRDPKAIPKIVSGVDSPSLERAVSFYQSCGFIVVSAESTRDAEAAKLLENTYRAVNIALINELAQASGLMGFNIGEAIRLASTKPFGFHAFYPGAGVGGHCIPIDPVYLKAAVSAAGGRFGLLSTTLELNKRTPSVVATRISEIAKKLFGPDPKRRITLLGMTYKPDVNDFRESPGAAVAIELQELGFEVAYHDPFLYSPLVGLGSSAAWLGDDLSFGSDEIVVLLQDHPHYGNLKLQLLPENQRLCAGVSSGPWTSIWDSSSVFDDFRSKPE